MQVHFVVVVVALYCIAECSADATSWAQLAMRAASDSKPFRQPTPRSYEDQKHDSRAHNDYSGASRRRPSTSRYGECQNNYDMDFIVLSLQWAPGFCRTSPEHCAKMQDRHFTIHGLWPTKSNSHQGPSNCCFNNKFDPKALDPIVGDLDEYWPSLISRDNYRFWSHEWLKHGTCAKNVASISGQYNYFSSTVDRVKRMQILDTLKAAGIVPSKSRYYSAVDIQNALRQIHGASKVQIDCDYEHDQPIPILKGINFCFDSSMKPIDCWTKNKCSRNVYLVS